MKNWQKTLVRPELTLREAMAVIDRAAVQLALVVDAQGRLLGTLTDGDLRRSLLQGCSLEDLVARAMNSHPTTMQLGDSRADAVSLMRRRGFHQIPIVDARGVVVGLETMDEHFIPQLRDNWVVVMAGGLGSRMGALTSTTPKPMLRIGERPLLEIILRSLVDQGFRRLHLAVNYRAEVIEAHFGDGARLGAQIRYLREPQRMGTAGALSLLPEPPTAPLMVINGDLLARVDYGDMLDSHKASGAVATMAVREFEFQIPYGVVCEAGGSIVAIEEKPIHRSLVSTGMYVLSPDAVARVPRGVLCDMPTLFDDIIAAGGRTRCYTIHGYWLDVGQVSDYEKANLDFATHFQ
jgi:dTDP-glucose pyrophosphorylase